MARRLNEDHSDCTGAARPCPHCGHPARYAGRRRKTFETVLTGMALERAYYACGACRRGLYPREEALGMADTDLSPGVTRMTGAAAGLVSFARASGLLADLAGVLVGTKHVERTAKALGREIAAAARHGAFPPELPSAVTMYLGVDGTGVPMRQAEVAGRAGKQADGSAKTREAKLVLVWTAEDRDKHGRPRCDAGSVTYSAAIESAARRDSDPDPSQCARRMRREAARRGFQLARHRAVLGDGARWIWRVATELFPGAIQIVDYFHASEKVWEVASALGGGKAQVKAWAEARCADLWAGHLDGLLATLRAHAAGCELAGKCADYMERNRDRMRYPDFRAQGLQVGSGVVEGGCKNVVGGRLKQSGMRWTKDGADAVLELRCCILSGRYEQFWELRTDDSGRREESRAASDPAPARPSSPSQSRA